MIESGTRVSTPEGTGIVVYARMLPPDFYTAGWYSVKLDSKHNDPTYSGTMFSADQISTTNQLECE